MTNILTVAQHYDFREEEDRDQRRENAVYQLKQFNNLLKRAFINEAQSYFATAPVVNVCDLCGGKGGDLKKWLFNCINTNQKINYVLLDASRGEVERALKRYNELTTQEKSCFVNAQFICLDVFDYDAAIACQQLVNCKFDIISCQFALHYAYESEKKSIGFWKVVDWLSKPNSYLLLSHPCRQRVIEWSRAHPCCIHPNERLDNDVCGICFTDPRLEHLFRNSTLLEATQQAPQFGACYRFTLKDSLFQVPEFLMPRTIVLHKQALEYARYTCRINSCAETLLHSDCFTTNSAKQAVNEAKKITISAAEYEVACLYQYSVYYRSKSLPSTLAVVENKDTFVTTVTNNVEKITEEKIQTENTLQPRRSARVPKKVKSLQ